MANTHNIHFVGSLGLADAETAFKTLAETVGDGAKRYPDGEHGGRTNWIGYQIQIMEENPGLELGNHDVAQFGGIEFRVFGYADATIASY